MAGPHCGSFQIKLQHTGESGFPAPRKSGRSVQADGGAWRLEQTHRPFLLQAKVLFLFLFFVGGGDQNLPAMCHLNVFAPVPLFSLMFSLSLSLFPPPLFLFGLMGCSLLHFRPRRLITSKEPLKFIS